MSLDNKPYWAFACTHLGPKKAHIFLALPDPMEPQTPDGLLQWVKWQESKKAKVSRSLT